MSYFSCGLEGQKETLSELLARGYRSYGGIVLETNRRLPGYDVTPDEPLR